MRSNYFSFLLTGLALLLLSFTIGCSQSQPEAETVIPSSTATDEPTSSPETEPASTPPPSPTIPVPPEPAHFVLAELTITPTVVQAGEVVTISIAVSNAGGTEGSYTVVFKVTGKWTMWENVEVTLKPGQTKTVTFTSKGHSRRDASGLFEVQPGTYEVNVNGKIGQFTVTEPAVTTPAPPTPEELEAKQIIKDLAYIKVSSWPYSLIATVTGIIS